MTAPQFADTAPDLPGPDRTGPIRLRALLAALTLTPGPVRLPARPPSAARPGACWFVADRTSVEVVSDDPITLASSAGTFAPHPDAIPSPRWVITVLRTASLDAAPAAFIGTPMIEVAPRIRARYHHDPTLGDSWWIAAPPLIIHNNPRSRWVGVRYTDPAAALDWTPRIIARLLATPIEPRERKQEQEGRRPRFRSTTRPQHKYDDQGRII